MLRKKYTVQKSLRLDSDLSSDLEMLSKILERPQNELINLAIQQLLIENQGWFAANIIFEHFKSYIENGAPPEDFDMQGVHVKMVYFEKDNNSFYDIQVKTPAEEYHKVIDEMDDTSMLEILRNVAYSLDLSSPEVQEWLKSRMDYR